MENEKEEKSSGQLVGTSSPLPVSPQGMSPLGTAFQGLQLGLTEKDLEDPGTRKLLIEMYRQRLVELGDLKEYQQKYYDADKRAAISEEKLRSNTAFDLVYGILLAFGGVVLGLSRSFWNKDDQLAAIVIAGIGFVLMLLAILVKLFLFKK